MKPLPLAGIRVLDLTQIYQGPYATFMMAMGGAEVIKIEPPGGERTRRGGGENTPLAFAMLNSNKKSITLDLKRQKAKDLFLDMVEHADMVTENFAPGTMDRLGIGWEAMRARNPKLIYGSANGYGSFGPDWDQLAMDHTVQAASGIMSVTGEAGGPPARAGGQVCDIMGGAHFYGALVTALLGRERTGEGTRVESAMVEAIYFNISSEYSHYHRTGEIPPRRGDKSAGQTAPYGRYQCTDGWVALIVVSEPQWKSLCRLLGREELADDPAYAGPVLRNGREEEINGMISDWTRDQSREAVFAKMRAARLPVAPVRDVAEVMNDRHLHERGMLNRMAHPYMGDVVLPSSPLRLFDYERPPVEFFPEIGANNKDVLADLLGMSEGDVQALAADGVI